MCKQNTLSTSVTNGNRYIFDIYLKGNRSNQTTFVVSSTRRVTAPQREVQHKVHEATFSGKHINLSSSMYLGPNSKTCAMQKLLLLVLLLNDVVVSSKNQQESEALITFPCARVSSSTTPFAIICLFCPFHTSQCTLYR